MSVRSVPSSLQNVVNEKGEVVVEQLGPKKWNLPYASSSYLHSVEKLREIRDGLNLAIENAEAAEEAEAVTQ